MKLLFVKDNLPAAMAGDVLDVKSGYGRNYLLPRGIAIAATDKNLEHASELRAQAEKRRAAMKLEMVEVADKINNEQATISAVCSESGRLYGSVTPGTIAQAVSDMIGRPLTRKNIRVGQPIRMTGTHSVKVILGPEVEATLKLTVKPDVKEVEGEPKAESKKGSRADADSETPKTDESVNETKDTVEPESQADAPATDTAEVPTETTETAEPDSEAEKTTKTE